QNVDLPRLGVGARRRAAGDLQQVHENWPVNGLGQKRPRRHAAGDGLVDRVHGISRFCRARIHFGQSNLGGLIQRKFHYKLQRKRISMISNSSASR
ncbi:MAG: hypothetical protein RLZZ296_2241, partial [Pseudomonadota bacterium]